MMTIGHSTLGLEVFLHALRENGCTTLVDVRRFPGSRRHPQFGQDRLFAALHEAGVRAVGRGGVGGGRGGEEGRGYKGGGGREVSGGGGCMVSPGGHGGGG